MKEEEVSSNESLTRKCPAKLGSAYMYEKFEINIMYLVRDRYLLLM